MKKKVNVALLVPVGISLVFSLLAFIGVTQGVESKIYDGLLHLRPAPAIDKNITLIDIDDPSISAIGTWPIARTITADALMLMAEMGSRYAVFDIEYVNKSPRGVNAEVLQQNIPETLDGEMGSVQNQIKDLFTAIARGQLSISDAGSYVNDLVDLVDKSKGNIKSEIDKIALDSDEYLAEAVRFFGKAFLTIHMEDDADSSVPQELRDYATSHEALTNLEVKAPGIYENPEISPVISPIIENAAGAGFTNVFVDTTDGSRRRIDLIRKYKDYYFPQLVFAAVLDLLGRPKLTQESNALILHDAHMPDGTVKTIRVPYSQDHRILLDWPHTKYIDSYKHVSFVHLYNHQQLWQDLIDNLKSRESWGYLDLYQGSTPLLKQNQDAETLKTAIMEGREPQSRVADYRAMRDSFLKEMGTFLDSKPEDVAMGQIAQALQDPKIDAATKAEYQKIQADAPDFFAKTRSVYKSLMEDREYLSRLDGSLAIMGQTSTGSTDLGVNPFESSYPNVGTHATVANMILNNRFLTDVSPIWSALLAFALSIAIVLIIKSMKPAVAISVGAAGSVLFVALVIIFFLITSLYVPIFPIAASVILSFVAVTFINFLTTEREKGFLRSAFSRYLSNDVIKEIVANPEKLQLGGQEKTMTAMFTDIRGFSTISEKLTPTELVHLLNQYLTAMSDIVLDSSGTIDKYEGDAIIAFFGAPLDLPDHAERACLAAIQMKRVEAELNTRFLAEGITSSPLVTRIGINTGEMVVGNMGTLKKMDYTIIGDSVNLAARLEGVNKQYGSWILVSEDTINKAGDRIVARKLDRVRVVGKSIPIRIFDLLEERDHIAENVSGMLDLFHEGLELFEERKWKKASEKFVAGLRLVPEDGPCQRYIKLCKQYETTPPAETWDGIYTLDMK